MKNFKAIVKDKQTKHRVKLGNKNISPYLYGMIKTKQYINSIYGYQIDKNVICCDTDSVYTQKEVKE